MERVRKRLSANCNRLRDEEEEETENCRRKRKCSEKKKNKREGRTKEEAGVQMNRGRIK